MFNVDGTENQSGSITHVVNTVLRYRGHSERAYLAVTSLGKSSVILGYTWLRKHNPEVDWTTGDVAMSRCSPNVCTGCRDEARTQRKADKRTAECVRTCSSGPTPDFAESLLDSELADETIPTFPSSQSPDNIEIEIGDRIWAHGLVPKAEEIRATGTTLQRLAEAFKANSDAQPFALVVAKTLRTSKDTFATSQRCFRTKPFRGYPNRALGTTPSNSSLTRNRRIARFTRSRPPNRRNSTSFCRRI